MLDDLMTLANFETLLSQRDGKKSSGFNSNEYQIKDLAGDEEKQTGGTLRRYTAASFSFQNNPSLLRTSNTNTQPGLKPW